ncbi:uncharacterized protein FFB20_00745 [Fusarium fujikuroi]|nr:uncharacterized protein FFB20_00745 [Fusarium fujikuroi]SCN70868.1 uncharacterized protein FFE2_02150 [Fusarium fujikuroi]SCO14557.1 uncharacterized protein FFC1_12184 [Fusarium fujikuroi]SCO14813.1 uncharacterized protein FFM5_10977 [Fusarium fujikuroi]SCO57408.1 uncharacterized protein FFMR_14564 [Fusarium fujikuroi]
MGRSRASRLKRSYWMLRSQEMNAVGE